MFSSKVQKNFVQSDTLEEKIGGVLPPVVEITRHDQRLTAGNASYYPATQMLELGFTTSAQHVEVNTHTVDREQRTGNINYRVQDPARFESIGRDIQILELHDRILT
jgi:hypothetical protein